MYIDNDGDQTVDIDSCLEAAEKWLVALGKGLRRESTESKSKEGLQLREEEGN